MNPGDKVICLKKVDVGTKSIELFGDGTYLGIGKVERGICFAGMEFPETISNPRIQLDSGEIVYGCECWFGNRRTMQRRIDGLIAEGFVVVRVDINTHREEGRRILEEVKQEEESSGQKNNVF